MFSILSNQHADSQGSNYAYTLPTIEEPDRAIQQLTNLARGHALTQGRNYIALDDIRMIIKVVLSTASQERVTIFDLLLAHTLITYPNLGHAFYTSSQWSTGFGPVPPYVLADLYSWLAAHSGFTNHTAAAAAHATSTPSSNSTAK